MMFHMEGLTVILLVVISDSGSLPSQCSGFSGDADYMYEATEQERFHEATLQNICTRMNNRIRPNLGDGPVTVALGMLIMSLGSIDERSMDFKLTFHLEQTWQDRRLRYNGSHFQLLHVPPEMLSRAWKPDLYFVNDIKTEAYSVPSPNVIFMLKPDGSVSFITRMTSRLSCPMNLQRYPVDTQTCPLLIESYAYDTSEMVLEMLPRGVEVDSKIRLPRYNLVGKQIKNCTRRYPSDFTDTKPLKGYYPCILIELELKRQIGFYLLLLYLPSALMVALSWLSFWINVSASVERMSLGVTLLLTLTTMFYGARTALPEVSYLTALDLWMTICLVFVVAAILEFAVVNVRSRHDGGATQVAAGQNGGNKSPKLTYQQVNNTRPDEKWENKRTVSSDTISQTCPAVRVDYLSRVLFPLMFAAFNALYWPLYTM